MRIAIVGLGLRAGNVLKMMKEDMPEMELVGYVDPDPCGLLLLKDCSSELTKYKNLEKMIDECKLDLLWVASPNHLHLEHIKTGLEAGLKVFSEKPIVTTKNDSFALAKLIKKYGESQLMVGLVLRYSQHMQYLRRAIDGGLLGRITSIEANEHIAPYHGSFFMRDWRRLKQYSGGFMLEKCCHDLDLYNSIVGERPSKLASFGGRHNFIPQEAPESGKHDDVYQSKESFWNFVNDPFDSDGDIVDHQNALLEYPSGVSFSFHTSINVPDEHRRFCIIGSRGMAEGDFLRGDLCITDARTGACLEKHNFNDTEAHKKEFGFHYGADKAMCLDIIGHLRGEINSLPVGAKDAIEAGLTAMKIDESRESGQMISMATTWSELDKCYLGKKHD
jgi:predicted dehydrogenase